jgi:anti-anti-sigma factor
VNAQAIRILELEELFASCDGNGPLAIDMSRVTFIDSSVLNLLMRLRRQNPSQSIALTGVSKQIRRTLQIASVDGLFEVSD